MLSALRHKVRVLISSVREKKKENQRSPEWGHVRDQFLKKHSSCAACGSSEKLQVHHKMPFHINPKLELDEDNLITLCMSDNECHLQIGHGDSWQRYNPRVEEDAKKFMSSDKSHRELLVEDIKAHRIHASKID